MPTPCSAPVWTVLIYLNGDNNLDFMTFELFNKLEDAADNPCIRILALWDRSQIGDTARYLVQPDTDPYVLATYTDNVNRWPLGERNMGDPQTLVNFVTDARTTYSSTYTFLALVDHGNGWSPSIPAGPQNWIHAGMSFDDSSGGAYLSTSSLANALGVITNNNGTRRPIDLVFFDACLMSMAENLYPIRSFVSYLVASENETFSSYPYTNYLGAMTADMQPRELAIRMVDQYHESLYGYPRTMGAYNLDAMGSVAHAVDVLARALNEAVGAYRHQIMTSFVSSQRFDSNVDLRLTDTDGYVDAYDFARLVKQNVPSGAVQAAAQSVMDAISAQLMVHERHASGFYWGNGAYWDLQETHGLSIYLPLGRNEWLLDYYNATELAFAADTAWDEFIRTMIAAAQPPRTTPEPLDPHYRPGPLVVRSRYLPLLKK